MLFPPDSLRKRLAEAAERFGENAEPAEMARELLEIDPLNATAYTVLGNTALQSGDLAEAERCFWKGLELKPFGFPSLSGLSQVHRTRNEGDSADVFWCLGLWALALSVKIDPAVAERLQDTAKAEFDYRQPETYRLLAEHLESELKKKRLVPRQSEPLRPYWLLKQLASGELEDPAARVLENIRAEAGACVPVLHAALRAWARDPDQTSAEALPLMVALLGELGGPEMFADLWELSTWSGNDLFLHTHWALCRMAVRFPKETVESILAELPAASTSLRCGMAEHLWLMKGVEGAAAAIPELMKDFSKRAKEEDGPYLLLIASAALVELGESERSQELLAQYEGLLSKDDRLWLAEQLQGPNGFVPTIVKEQLPGLDIEDVCLGRALMGETDDFSEEEDEDLFEEPEPPAIKLGRNDSCWCGSGKKYKKCHLDSDEEAARAEAAEPDDDPVRTEALDALFETSERMHKSRDMKEAARLYFGHDIQEEDLSDESDGFFLWYLFDFRSKADGRTVVEEHLHRHGERIKPEMREAMEAWRDSRYGLFSVAQDEITDLYTGDSLQLSDAGELQFLEPGDHILARVEQWRGRTELSGDLLPVSPEALGIVQEFIATEAQAAGQTPAQFVRANIHRLHRVAEGMEA